MGNTSTRAARKTSRKTHKPNANDEIKANLELAIQEPIDYDAPDLAAFLARWSFRYAEANLLRLWAQRPTATVLHYAGTWMKMGRMVKAGEKAIWLRIPRTHKDADKITERNPEGKVFSGAPWAAFFDYSQTRELTDHEEANGLVTDLGPDALAEIKRLKAEAMALHTDHEGIDNTPENREAFSNAWRKYENARDASKAA